MATPNRWQFDDLSLEVDDQAPLYSVTITPQGGKAQLPVGGTLQLVAVTSGGEDSQYSWSSSFNAVAMVDTNGLVTANQAGRFTVQAEGTTTHAVGYLDIVAYSPNSLVIIEPHQEAEWQAGATENITWELIDLDAPLSLAFRSAGSDWIPVASDIDATALQYAYTVPATDVVLNQCQFRLSWDGGESFSSLFTIQPVAAQPIILSLQMYAGITVSGPVGTEVQIQYVNQLTSTNWQTIDTLILTNNPQLWFDIESPGYPKRFYRAIIVP